MYVSSSTAGTARALDVSVVNSYTLDQQFFAAWPSDHRAVLSEFKLGEAPI